MSGREDSEEESEDDIISGKGTDSDEEDDGLDIFADGGGDEKETKEMFKELNKDVLDMYVCSPFSDGCQSHYVVCFGSHNCWYQTVDAFQVQMKHFHKRRSKPIPEMIENLAEHKLRVKYSPTNELVLNQNKTWPKTRWYTVISVPDDAPHQMKAQLKRLSDLFKNCFSERLKFHQEDVLWTMS